MIAAGAIPRIEGGFVLDVVRYLDLKQAVIDAGYGSEIDWSESVGPPKSPEAFAVEAIFVICNSGLRAQVGRKIFNRVMAVIRDGHSASIAFSHQKKAQAIDLIWSKKEQYFSEFLSAADKVEYCGHLPWIGDITKWHLAKNFGVDVAKPDRHLVRLASASSKSVEALCGDLAAATGDRVATVDLVLWRACNLGIIDSKGLDDGGAPAQAP